MNEMIEKIARGIYDSYQYVRPWDHPKTQALHGVHTRRAAIAALEAARDMSDSVAEAIAKQANCCGGIAYSIWSDAIDACLEHQP